MKIFLEGNKGVGKSTIIEKILSDFDGDFGGFVTKKMKTSLDEYGGIFIFDVNYKNLKPTQENRVGICGLEMIIKKFSETFDKMGVEFLSFKSKPDLVVMDELGVLEKNAVEFKKRVIEVINQDIDIIGVIKKKEDGFLKSIRQREDILIFEVTLENRDDIYNEINTIL